MRQIDSEHQRILNALFNQIKDYNQERYVDICAFSERSSMYSHNYLNWLLSILYQKNWNADYSIQERTDHLRESITELNKRVIYLEGHETPGDENRIQKDEAFDEEKIDLFLEHIRNEIVQTERRQKKERLRLAVFTPLSPLKNGIADYMTVILLALRQYAQIDIYIDEGYEPDNPDILQSFAVYQHGKFHELHDRYDLILYEIGNNPHHLYIVPYVLRYPGILELHDFCLDYLYRLLPLEYQNVARAESPYLGKDGNNPWNMYLLKASRGVLVHSEYSRQAVFHETPTIDVRKIELFAKAVLEDQETSHLVKKHGLEDCFLFSCFGFMNYAKRIEPIIVSFSNIVQKYPGTKFKLLIIGEFTEEFLRSVKARIRKHHLKKHVVMTGYVTLDDMYKYISLMDVCMNLRYPYGGESSGTLARIMGMGKACIVNRVGAFDEIPDSCCHKIAYEGNSEKEIENITGAMSLLFENSAYRKWIATNAQTYVMEHLNLDHMIQLYRESLDHFYCKPTFNIACLMEKASSFLAYNYFDDPYHAAAYFTSRLHSFFYDNDSEEQAEREIGKEPNCERKDILQLIEEIDADPRIAIIFAYRYLLNREPESLLTVERNQLGWKELREQFLASEEYRRLQADIRLKEVEEFHLTSYEKDFLKKILCDAPLLKCEKILEIGCGSGKLVRALAHFCPEARVTGIDPCLKEWRATGEASGANWQLKIGDGQNIEYPADTFDLVVSVATFEHIPSPKKCLGEIKRVLKPNGLFMTHFAPIWSGIIGHHCEHWDEDTVKMIPPWGHLYLSYDEMFQYLISSWSIDLEQVRQMCNTIYQDTSINRVDVKSFEEMFSNCGMKVIEKTRIESANRLAWLTGDTRNELTPDILQKLDGRYTMEELLVCGYTLTMQK